MDTAALIKQIEEEPTYTDVCEKADQGICAIVRMAFTHMIITGCTPWGYENRWCYHSYEKAKEAFDAWDGSGEPIGWHRHPSSGRRVDPETGEIYIYF